MIWRAIFGFDLASKLEKWKRHYRGDARKFNFRSVWVSSTKWNSRRFTVAAGAFCADPNATGFDSSNIFWFYRSPEFQTEAEAHITRELRRASRKHKQTNFYRSRVIEFLEVNGKIERRITVLETFDNGDWQETNDVPSLQRCRGCGSEVNSDVCS